MELTIQKPVIAIALRRGETLTLHDARGLRIVGQSGVVWITEERGEADHIVQPGFHFTVTRAGRTVLEALKTGVVEIDETDGVHYTPQPVRVLIGSTQSY